MNFGKCNFYLRKANFDDIVASSAGILQEKEGRNEEWEKIQYLIKRTSLMKIRETKQNAYTAEQ